jgi:hypothetical protein
MDDKLIRYADVYLRELLSIEHVDNDLLIKKAFWAALSNVLRGAAMAAARAAPRAAAAAAGTGAAISGAARATGGVVSTIARQVATKASVSGSMAITRAEMAAIEKGLSTEAAQAFRIMSNSGLTSIKQLPPNIIKGLDAKALASAQSAYSRSVQLAGKLSDLQRISSFGSNIANTAKANYASALAAVQTFKSAPLSTRAGKVMLSVSVLAGFLIGPPSFQTQEGKQISTVIPKTEPIVPSIIQSAKEAIAFLEVNKNNIEHAEVTISEINKFINLFGNLNTGVIADDPNSAGTFTQNVRNAEQAGIELLTNGNLDNTIAEMQANDIATDKINNLQIAIGGFLNGVDGIRGKAAVAVFESSSIKKEAWVQLALFITPLVGMAGRYIANISDSLDGLKKDLDYTAELSDKQIQEGSGKFLDIFKQYSQAAKQASDLINIIKTPPKSNDDPAQINAAVQFSNSANIVLNSMQGVLNALSEMRGVGSYIGEAIHLLSLDFGLFDATRYQAFQNAFSRMQNTLQKTVQNLDSVIAQAQNDAGEQVALEQAQQAQAQTTTKAENIQAGELAGMENISI